MSFWMSLRRPQLERTFNGPAKGTRDWWHVMRGYAHALRLPFLVAAERNMASDSDARTFHLMYSLTSSAL